ncbi:MAG: hypothetical protein IVW56_04555 [Candidatus Binataceae bacterium]|nr:hypothetical protein [Candidatus Binataceae bacterium]
MEDVLTFLAFACSAALMLAFAIHERNRGRRFLHMFGVVLFFAFVVGEAAILAQDVGADDAEMQWCIGGFALAAIMVCRLTHSALSRVRLKIALGWLAGIVLVPAMFFAVTDDWKDGHELRAAVEGYGAAQIISRWLTWMDRQRARRKTLLATRAAGRDRASAVHAEWREKLSQAKH